MAKGFVYLAAVANRKVLTHKVAVTLEACHAKETLQEAFAKFGTPEIVNTDQGSQGHRVDLPNRPLCIGCNLLCAHL